MTPEDGETQLMDDGETAAGSGSDPTAPVVTTDDDKRRVIEEYDAADFRTRHLLLEREGISIRDIARWRREIRALRTAAADAAPDSARKPRAAAKAKPAAKSATVPRAPSRAVAARASRVSAAPPEIGSATSAVALHVSAAIYHADQLRLLLSGEPTEQKGRDAAAVKRLASAAETLESAAAEIGQKLQAAELRKAPRDSEAIAANLTSMVSTLTDYSSLAVGVQILVRELTRGEVDVSAPTAGEGIAHGRRPWWGNEPESS